MTKDLQPPLRHESTNNLTIILIEGKLCLSALKLKTRHPQERHQLKREPGVVIAFYP